MSAPILRHKFCREDNCKTCLSDHLALQEYFQKRIGGNQDYLAKYRLFMDRRLGRSTETEWGWADPVIFEQANLDAFVNDYL